MINHHTEVQPNKCMTIAFWFLLKVQLEMVRQRCRVQMSMVTVRREEEKKKKKKRRKVNAKANNIFMVILDCHQRAVGCEAPCEAPWKLSVTIHTKCIFSISSRPIAIQFDLFDTANHRAYKVYSNLWNVYYKLTG